MTPSVRGYLIQETTAGFIINAVLNGAIAWALRRSQPFVPVADAAADLVITMLILGFLAALVANATARKNLAAGKAPRIAWRRSSHALLRRLPMGNAPRALVLAACAAVVFAGIAAAGFGILGLARFTTWAYVVFKAFYTGLAGAAIGFISELSALGDAAPPETPSLSAR